MNLDRLNPQQQKAVLLEKGPLLILAGAGSGKTRTLTARIAHLVEQGIMASRLLAITFTNKAAREMKERLEELVGTEAHYLWVGTFHAISLRILRKYGHLLGYEKDFVIYDGTDQRTLVGNCLKELNMDSKRYPAKMVRVLISQAKSQMTRLSEYRNHLDDDLWEVFELYERKLKEYQAMDFDNILFKVVELFEENEEVRLEYAQRFHEVLVDEYQDTNRIQYQLIQLLTKDRHNLVVVGDVDQSIYGWRGADIRNIMEFKKDFKDARVITLEQNYRSTKRILEAANALIENNPSRPKKNLWTDLETGDKITLFHAKSDQEEADYVLTSIHADLTEGVSPRDIAVLYRTHAQSRLFEERLRKANIPYQIYGGLKFYDRKEIKDVLAYLKVLVNPLDEVSLLRAITTPRRGLGEGSIIKISQYAAQQGLGFYEGAKKGLEESVFTGRISKPLGEFISLFEERRPKLEEEEPYLLSLDLLEQAGYLPMLKESKLIEDQGRLDNVQELLSDIASFYERGEGGLDEYLLNVTLLTNMDEESHDNPVTLMTLHSAKGLEFEHVYLVGMDDDLFPSYLSKEENGVEEERRLCYVGITRAMKKLVLTRADTRFRFGEPQWMKPSPFLAELPSSVLYEEGKAKGSVFQRTIPFGEEKKGGSTSFAPGDKVSHKVFGQGVVVGLQADKKKIQVIFKTQGLKELHLDYAPLRKES